MWRVEQFDTRDNLNDFLETLPHDAEFKLVIDNGVLYLQYWMDKNSEISNS